MNNVSKIFDISLHNRRDDTDSTITHFVDSLFDVVKTIKNFFIPLNVNTDSLLRTLENTGKIKLNSVNIQIHTSNASKDFDYEKFIFKIQSIKMRELWDNDEDEAWEYA